MDVGEPVVAAGVAEGEAFVVDAELVQQRSVDVVDAHGVARDGVAELVGFAVSRPRLHPGSKPLVYVSLGVRRGEARSD